LKADKSARVVFPPRSKETGLPNSRIFFVFSRTADGRLKQTLGTSQDISKRKKVELALREAEYNLRLANQELEKLVNIDGLTQIANRRCFDHRLEQ
jgi:predicted signal transduction protein with EAL and GGDEF domain